MVEWSITAVLKTAALRGAGGSNPSLSAHKGNLRVTFFPYIRGYLTPRRGLRFTGIVVMSRTLTCLQGLYMIPIVAGLILKTGSKNLRLTSRWTNLFRTTFGLQRPAETSSSWPTISCHSFVMH